MRHSERSRSSGEARNLARTGIAFMSTAEKLTEKHKMKPKCRYRELRTEN
jgi:hypothetical protein